MPTALLVSRPSTQTTYDCSSPSSSASSSHGARAYHSGYIQARPASTLATGLQRTHLHAESYFDAPASPSTAALSRPHVASEKDLPVTPPLSEWSSPSSPTSPSSGTTTPASSEGCSLATQVRVPAQTWASAAAATPCLSPSALSETEVLRSPALLSTASPTPLASPHRPVFHFASSEQLRQQARPALLRTSSDINTTALLMQQQHWQQEGASADDQHAATAQALGSSMKRSQSLPPQLLFRDSFDGLDERPESLLTRRLSDVAIDDKFGAGRMAKARANERRYRALLELVETEEAYLQDLQILNDVFFNALHFTPLHPSARALICRNIDQILRWHQSLHTAFATVDHRVGWRMSDLAAAEGKWDDAKVLVAIEAVMHVFKQRAQGLQLYETFCAQHSDAASLLRQHESSKHTWDVYIGHCNTILEARFPQATVGPRLTLYDYLIKPVQRICRYPLMLSQLKSFLDMSKPEEAAAASSVQQALDVVRGAAAAVDSAKMLLVSQRRTRNVASRMEMPSSTRPAFLGILGQVSLAGALYFTEIPSHPDGPLRVKYFGCFLYESHLVIVKVKRQDSYEPRHWFPLRAFQIDALPESEGLLPHSLRLRHGSRTFELAATCGQERDLWVQKLQETAADRKRTWLEAIFHNPVAQPYDDFVISSVAIEQDATPPAESTSMHQSRPPPIRPNLSSSSLNSLQGRSRFSAANILGKSTASSREAIDLRLAEVFSDALLVARVSGEEEYACLHTRPGLLTGLRPKNGPPQSSQLSRRGTTRDIQQRKTTILENSAPIISRTTSSQPATHQRRSSVDADGTPGRVTSTSPLHTLQRSKTNPAKPRTEPAQPVNRRSWTGSLRRRTSSWMSSQPPSRHTLEQQVSVARNDSSSSSGSSRDMVRTPSPMSSAPPSPLVQPADSPQLREMPLPIPRQSSSGFGSPEQDLQALRASKYLYDSSSDTDSKSGWMSSVRGKRGPASGLSLKGHSRSHSSVSLLSLFTPALSPTAPSPLGEEGPQQQQQQQPSSPVSPVSPTSQEVSLAELVLAQTRPVSLSPPPPPKTPLRRTKSKRFSSLFPLTRLNSGNTSTTSLASP